MAATIEVYVSGQDGRIQAVDIPMRCHVDVLRKKIALYFGLGQYTFNLLVDGQLLKHGRETSALVIRLPRRCTVFVLLGLLGGISPIEAARINYCGAVVRDPTPLAGFITLTNEADMLDLDEDAQKAKMPCGHIIGSYGMTEYCKIILSAGKYRFICPSPQCEQEWPYFLVRHVACLTDAERKYFETKISENYMNLCSDLRECPGCGNWCERMDPTNNCVRCVRCTKARSSDFQFCWVCLQDWRGVNSRSSCGNATCMGVDPGNEILRRCEKKQVNGVLCPSLRACPNCHQIIEHTKHCKHMTCGMGNCDFEFCFICLQPWGQCGEWDSRCSPAPDQTLGDAITARPEEVFLMNEVELDEDHERCRCCRHGTCCRCCHCRRCSIM